jgi:aspartate aminotransferase
MPVSKKIDDMMAGSSWIRRMFEEGNRLRAEHGADNVFDFSLGNPNLEPPERFDAVLKDLVLNPRPGMHGYMPNAGYPATRAAVAGYLSKEQEVALSGDHVVMCVGAGGALNVVFKAVLDEGDEVITPNPRFVEYDTYVDNHGGVCKHVQTTPEFDLDLEAFEAAIGPRTRIVLVNSPNNPTGRVYSRDTLERLGALLKRKEAETGRIIFLLSDEPYRKIVYGDVVVPPILSAYEHSILVTSYSKDLSLAGERIGFVAANPAIPGVEKLMGGLTLANRILGFVNAPALMQLAVAQLQGEGVDIGFYQRNRDMLYGTLVESGFTVPHPDGAFYLFPKSPLEDDVAFVRELAERLVLAVPGSGFGGPGHFRLAYCVSPKTVEGSLPVFKEVGKKYFG